MVIVTGDDQHSDLRQAWQLLHADLLDLRGYLGFGATFYQEFADKADRATNLAFHLDAVVQLVDRHLYAPAFAMTRTCLEHTVLDWLLFRGSTFVARHSGVTPEKWAQYQADRAAGADWTRKVVHWDCTKKGDLTIHWGGLYSEEDENGDIDQVSVYYFLLEEYDGMLGKPSEQVGDRFLSREELRTMATENQDRWNVYLRWSALLENLSVNRLIDETDRGRLGVHYRFLSAFAHPVSHTQRQLYGNHLDGGPVHYDHYASELALLYVVTLAALELQNFRADVDDHPGVALRGSATLDAHLRVARRAAAHLWFIGTNPHHWDIHNAHYDACLAAYDAGEPTPTLPPSAADVPFAPDPLDRLVRMHATTGGIFSTGDYLSPWPRQDAWNR